MCASQLCVPTTCACGLITIAPHPRTWVDGKQWENIPAQPIGAARALRSATSARAPSVQCNAYCSTNIVVMPKRFSVMFAVRIEYNQKGFQRES